MKGLEPDIARLVDTHKAECAALAARGEEAVAAVRAEGERNLEAAVKAVKAELLGPERQAAAARELEEALGRVRGEVGRSAATRGLGDEDGDEFLGQRLRPRRID
jgi:hypothetical protein